MSAQLSAIKEEDEDELNKEETKSTNQQQQPSESFIQCVKS